MCLYIKVALNSTCLIFLERFWLVHKLFVSIRSQGDNFSQPVMPIDFQYYNYYYLLVKVFHISVN